MADVRFRVPALLTEDGSTSADLVFVAIDNGDGTWNFSVDTGPQPAPSNYALEAGGNLAEMAADVDELLTVLPAARGTNGGLKVEGIANGTAVPVSGVVTSVAGGMADEAAIRAQLADLAPATIAILAAQPDPATPVANATAAINCAGKASVLWVVTVSDDWDGTLIHEAYDGATWTTDGIYAYDHQGNSTGVPITGAGSYFSPIGGYQQFRLRCNPHVAGTATVRLVAHQTIGPLLDNLIKGFQNGNMSVGASDGLTHTKLDTVASLLAAGPAHHASSVITIATGTGSLAARATRTGGFLRARKANTADIVVETTGLHLQAGDAMNFTAVDAFAFTGTNGDILDVYEEYN